MHNLLPPASLFGDERRSLEHGNVLLHGREAHLVAARQLGDRLFVFDCTLEDVPSRSVSKCPEESVNVGVR